MKPVRHSFLAAAALATFAALASAATTAADRAERAERRFETRYLTALIDDTRLTSQLAELIQTKATHEELQALGEQAETALAAELAQLQAWLQSWYGESHDAELGRKAERLVQELAQLSGEEFETEAIATLIEHRLDALREATRALQMAQRPELINAAALSIAAHADEVAQLRLWLEQWYGDGAMDGTDGTNGTDGVSTGVDVGVGGSVEANATTSGDDSSGDSDGGGLLDRFRGLTGRNGG